MAPSRFQCLNVATRLVNRSFNARAGFSTSQTRRADNPRDATSTAYNVSTAEQISSSIKTSPLAPDVSTPPTSAAEVRDAELISAPGQNNSNPITVPSGNDGASELIRMFRETKKKKDLLKHQASQETIKSMSDHFQAQDYSKHIIRRWKAGDVYAPHDLSGVEMRKWKMRQKPTHDIFDVLAFNPEEHYRNFNIMSEFMTPMGRIKHSNETGLRPVNQRRIARAIRRSIGIGMMPSVHRHPEILYRERERSPRVPERYKRSSGVAAPL